ncbi:MAG: hypothetical protein RIR02_141 [Pseudomonadota bacterium]|jgi:cytochrome c-type biogenesis protein CcmH
MNPTPEEIERLQRVSSELRCLVCQNQSIAESTAGLAVDLKQQALEQIQAGKSDEAIRSYMVERYGEFILYKPAFSASNAVLWSGPFVLLVLIFVVVVKSLRRRQQITEPITQATDVLRAAKLEERYKRDASNQ